MFDGNGNWTSDFSAQADRDNGIKILASRFDNIFIADIKESFENCLTKDGQITPIGNFNMGGQKITNLNAGVNDNDAVNKSQLDTKVDLTGTQTISGGKIFTPNIEIRDSADPYILFHIPGTIYTRLQESANGLEVRSGDGANLATLFAGDSDINHSIVTTVNKSKASNGYFKLGNGLIIQWGRFTNTNNTFTVTLPIPFTTNNYSIAYGCLDSQRSGDNTITTNTTSTTGFTGWISCHSTSLQSQWIAIGY